MPRLTIRLSEERHERLRRRAAIESKSLEEVIEEQLGVADEVRRETLADVIEAARANAAAAVSMSESELLELGVRLGHEIREEGARKPTAS